MAICRYFLQGTCRFGDKCRFEHTERNYDSYDNAGGYQERYGRQYGHSNNYQQSNQNRYESRKQYGAQLDRYGEQYRAESPSRYSTGGYYSNERQPDRYSEHYRAESPSSYSYGGYYSNERYNSPDRYADYYQNAAPRYSGTYSNQRQGSGGNYYKENYGNSNYYKENQRDYSTKNQYQSSNTQHETRGQRNFQPQDNRGGENVYGQNKFKWSSDDVKKQQQQKTHKDNHDGYNTSTPKSKVSFSFKVPESEIKKQSAQELNEQDGIGMEILKEDGKAWEFGGLWPFTCYSPIPNKPGFPGFYDLSPEELRYAAYKSEENNAFPSYVQAVQNVSSQINQQRSDLQVATPQLVATLRRIWKGENMCSSSDGFAIPFLEYKEVRTDVTPNAFPGNNAAATFSFKVPTETDSLVKSSAEAFSFKQPTETKAPMPTVSGGDAEIYTHFENLTEEEKEQFSASTFVLGKIPTKPPPQALCA